MKPVHVAAWLVSRANIYMRPGYRRELCTMALVIIAACSGGRVREEARALLARVENR